MFNNRSASSNRKLFKSVKKSMRVIDFAYAIYKVKQVLFALFDIFASVDLN